MVTWSSLSFAVKTANVRFELLFSWKPEYIDGNSAKIILTFDANAKLLNFSARLKKASGKYEINMVTWLSMPFAVCHLPVNVVGGYRACRLAKWLMALVMFVVCRSMQQLQEQMTARRFRSMLNLWDLWCPLECCCLDPVKIVSPAVVLHTTVTRCHPRRSSSS